MIYEDIPRALRDNVERELASRETIRWIGMPRPRFFTPASTSAFLFAIPWTGFAIFWTWGAAGFRLPNLQDGIGPESLFPLFGIPFILICLALLSTPIWTYRQAGRTVYVITDRRAITLEGIRVTTVRSYPPEKLGDVYRRERNDGTGDVIITYRAWRDSDGDRQSEELGFLRIREPKEVERMLKELATLRSIER